MENIAIEIDSQQGVYKTLILAHFFIVSIVAISINLVVLGIIIRRIYRGATVDLKISALVMILDFCAAIGTFIRAIICQDPRNLLVYDQNWCKFDTIFTTQLLLYSGVSIGVLSMERFLLVCYNIKVSAWVWIGIIFVMCGTQYSLFILNIVKNRQRIMKIAIYCTIGVAEAAEILRVVISFNLVSSYFMVVVSYISIVIFRYKHSRNQLSLNLPKDQVIREFLSTTGKSLLNLFLYAIIYFGKVYCLCYEVATGDLRTWLMDYIATILITCSLILNISVLLYMNIEIRKDFIRLISSLKLLI